MWTVPNEEQPSDHTPVVARLRVMSPHSRVEADARQWLNLLCGDTSSRPLMTKELRQAFTFFDKDGSGVITPVELEAALQLLGCSGITSQRVYEAVLGRTAALAEGESLLSEPIAFDAFANAYLNRIFAITDCELLIDVELKLAFAAFDMDGDGVLTTEEFTEAIRLLMPTPVAEDGGTLVVDGKGELREDDEAMGELVRAVDTDGDGLISLDEFMGYCFRLIESVNRQQVQAYVEELAP